MMRRYRLLFAALVCGCYASALAQTDTVRYSVLMSQNNRGVLKMWKKGDGSRNYFYEFNDRGRGPELSTRTWLDGNGIPITVETSGLDYFKNPVEDRLRSEGSVKRWTNPGEKGEKGLGDKSFYISINGPPSELGLLARALLLSPDRKLKLLPDGEAGIEKAGELSIGNGSHFQKVNLFFVTGLGFIPWPVYLDGQNEFFASGSEWQSVVRAGWESTVPTLLRVQDSLLTSRMGILAKQLHRIPSNQVVFVHANVFDTERGITLRNQTVVISKNRIVSCTPDAQAVYPSNAEVIDATNKTLMPGLWDMHTHIGDGEGLLFLASGITTIRDLGNDVDKIASFRQRFDANEDIGPRILPAGFVDGRGPYAGPTKVFADTPEEAIQVVKKYSELGYEQIKIYSSVKPALVPVIVREAHARNMRVGGHIPAFMTAEEAIRLGFDEIQHANFLFLNFLADSIKDTRTPVRFTGVARNAARIDLESPAFRSFIDLMKSRHTVIDPTVNIFESMFEDRPGVVSATLAAVADRLPAQVVRRDYLSGGLPVPAGMNDTYRSSFQQMLRLVKKLYDAGITIVAGTDAIAGFSLHRELELYVQAGIPASSVLQLATLGAARVMKKETDFGSVSVGKFADLILIDGDPSVRISDVRRPVLVMKGGAIYKPSDINRVIGVKPTNSH